MKIASEQLAAIVAHAQAEAPDECCGIVASDASGVATQVFAATNKHHSPLRFEVDERELYKIQMEIDNQGWDVGAIYHSHTRSEPYPSQTDVNMARYWPGSLWIIVGLDGGQPKVRTYLISEDTVEEVPLTVQ